MNKFLRQWLVFSFINLLLVAFLGFILRYKIAFYLPFVQQKMLLHSHSHFAFAGWITQTLMVLLVHQLLQSAGEQVYKQYRWLLMANLISAYGMLVSFMFQGYGVFSISFSTLSIFVSYFFATYYWKDLNRLKNAGVSQWWMKASLVFSVLSSLGAFSLAFIMANKIMHQNWYLVSIYVFLHFQYNGWFLFAGMGLLTHHLEKIPGAIKRLRIVFLLFCFACPPVYFLSALWLPIPAVLYWLILLAVIAQLGGWAIFVKILYQHKAFVSQYFTKYGKIFLLLSAIAFTIKLLLQTGSVHPALSQFSYGFRPIVIGYLHLVLLGVTSIFLIGYMLSFDLIPVNRKLITGGFVFVAGVIINELLLMAQGVTSFSYNSIPNINIYLLVAAAILFTGILLLLIGFISASNRQTG